MCIVLDEEHQPLKNIMLELSEVDRGKIKMELGFVRVRTGEDGKFWFPASQE